MSRRLSNKRKAQIKQRVVVGLYLIKGCLLNTSNAHERVIETQVHIEPHHQNLKEDLARGIVKRRFHFHITERGFTQMHSTEQVLSHHLRLRTNWDIIRAVQKYF